MHRRPPTPIVLSGFHVNIYEVLAHNILWLELKQIAYAPISTSRQLWQSTTLSELACFTIWWPWWVVVTSYSLVDGCTTRKNCGRINTKSTENRWSCLLFRSCWPGHWSTEGCWSVFVDLVTKKNLKKILPEFFGQKKIIFRVPGFLWNLNPTRLGLQG